ncbi:MAG: exo-beta-N-acetylmuramidase NamZ domain-containing protein, partial [Thermoanaerobaculia bacterium]
ASRYLPEFHGGWRDEVTIRHLLTHTSGLRPDLDLDKEWTGYDTAMGLAFEEMPQNRPGFVFRYSDINFELLGEIVQRVSGMSLDRFAASGIFEPLGMSDTRFRPRDVHRVAPTQNLRGVVHDPTARRMGGVAGHAGLFTTAHDLAIYARTIMNGGAPVFRPETVRAMTSVQSPPNVAVKRAGGWDIDSPFSRPRGDIFPIGSFGHTGFTGGFLWIDPPSRTFYVFLSNRVHPDGKGSVVALQRQLGTLVAELAEDRRAEARRHTADFANTRAGVATGFSPSAGNHTKPRVEWVTSGGSTQNGIDVLHATGYAAVRGMRIGLITNQSGIDRSTNPTIDLLRSAPNVTLVELFAPEHGVRGDVDEPFGDTTDPISGLPVYSLYGPRKKPDAQQLASIDAIVFDVQDIGTRFYTYVSRLGLAMEAAAEAKKKVIVLDRVNPIGGIAIEGPLPDSQAIFTAYQPVPVRHGMTVGELAKMIAAERHLDVDLEVVPIRHWSRDRWQDEAGLPWINTSPNMRSLTEAALYPGIGLLENAISVGRGTSTPFEVVGAPYVDAGALARAMNSLHLPGIWFEPARFTPDASIYADEECGGVRLLVMNRKRFEPVRTGLALAMALLRMYGA